MDTLPQTNVKQPNGNPASIKSTTPSGNNFPQTGTLAKETDAGGKLTGEFSPFTEIGKEIELPKEVSAVGVSVQPTAIPIPPNVSQMGVAPAGANVTVSDGDSVTLPLTDDQIVAGLHQNPTSSWRWLAEWCVRRLKQLHIIIKNIGGKSVEVRT
jgi:hypothetical protein